MSDKTFRLRPDQLEPIALGYGGCYASDRITVDGCRVGYLYREEPDGDWDSGWRFFEGHEPPDYVDDPDRFGLYDVNTIANYGRDVLPLLDSPPGTAYVRDESGVFVEEEAPQREDEDG